MSSRPAGLGTALAGVGLAYAAFGLAFRGPRAQFWQRLTATGFVLGAMALSEDPGVRPARLRGRDVGLGLLLASGLYAAFRLGDRFARHALPRGDRDIASIYELSELAPKEEIAARLAFVVAPAEELFWRGLVQRALAARFGALRGALLGAAAYGGAHVVTGNLTLVGAAATAGAWWSLCAAVGAPMAALVTSHIVWDVWIFLVAPTSEAGRR